MEEEIEGSINFLDICIARDEINNKFNLSIFRKQTFNGITINADSNHPFSQKQWAYNYFVERMITLPIDKQHKDKELELIQHIANYNGYKKKFVPNIKRRIISKFAHNDQNVE